jgi:hypothetical protein
MDSSQVKLQAMGTPVVISLETDQSNHMLLTDRPSCREGLLWTKRLIFSCLLFLAV